MSRLPARLYVLRRLARRLVGHSGARSSPASPARILVLQHLLLGDTLMLTPLLAKLAMRYPDAERFLACSRAFLPLFENRPYGIRAIGWNPRSKPGLQPLFDAAPYDLVIIPAENRYSPLARALGAKWVLAFADDQPAWKNWLVDEARPFPTRPAAFGDFCATLLDGPAPAGFKPDDWALPDCGGFSAPAGPYAVLHLGASTPLKFWPAARWQQLADWLVGQGITPVWSAGAKEGELVRWADPCGRFQSFAGQLDLAQLAHLFSRARLVVCPDTGVTHLARIVGVPTVALFGPGSSLISGAGEFWRDSPFVALSADIACRDQDVTFRRHSAWIRRCARSYGKGPGQCEHPRCMDGISLDTVIDGCQSLLGTPGG